LRYCHNSIRPQLQLLREEGLLESVQGTLRLSVNHCAKTQ
jgi:hypothetical protein